MSEDILTYYNREISWFRRALGSFSQAHPKAAGHLRISEDAVEDPHVSRLIESVAFLNARIQSRLDDDFPRIVAALLEYLYPFYLSPKPSMMLAQLHTAPNLEGAVRISSGFSLESAPVDDVHCRFTTCYPVTLLPLSISSASLLPKPFNTPGAEGASGASAVLEIKFECSAPDFNFAAEDVDNLNLHLKPGQLAWGLYDLLYRDCVNIVIARSDLDPAPIQLSSKHLVPRGQTAEERILPDIGDTATEYQLLSEFFHYSEKFLFFDITGLKDALGDHKGSFSLYIYLAGSHRELENSVSAQSFGLHCTPVVNLFEITAEPCHVKSGVAEYQVIPETAAIGDMEVYAITDVDLLEESSGDRISIPPYHGFSHSPEVADVYWHSSRRAALSEVGKRDAVTDVFISLTDLQGDIPNKVRQTMQVRCLCSNGNLPERLPYGGGQPRLTPVEPAKGLREAISVSAPTTVRRLDMGHGLLWRLLSHLNLNYLSLVGSNNPAEQLREMLRLYDHSDTQTISSQINSVDSLKTRITSLPLSVDGRPVICRGVDADIVFDPSLLDTGSALLFGEVLMKFLSMYVNINSFVRLSVRIKGQEGVYYRWQPIVGNRAVI